MGETKTLTRVLSDYHEELMRKIYDYFHPKNEDCDLFFVKLLRGARSDEAALEIFKVRENYYRSFFTFVLCSDPARAMSYIKELFDFCALLLINPPEMSHRISTNFPELHEYYQEKFGKKSK